MVQVATRESVQGIVKKDPWIGRQRVLYIIFLLYIPLLVLINLPNFLTRPTGFGLGLLIFLGLDFLLMVGLFVFQVKYWRKRRELRARAVEGDPVLLAADQPRSDARAASLPMVIKVHTRVRAMVVLGGIMLGIIVAAISIGFIIGFSQVKATHPHTNPQAAVPIILLIGGIALAFFVVVLVLAFALASWLGKQKIEVTEEGITSTLWHMKRHMRWDEARFFSIGGTANPKRATYYELSNEHTNVAWMELRSRNVLFSGALGPKGTSLEEYEDEMRKLREIVAGKTGLKLYDLRNKTKGWFAAM